MLPGGDATLDCGRWRTITGFIGDRKDPAKSGIQNSVVSNAVANLPVINASAISSAAGGGFVDKAVMTSQKPEIPNGPIKKLSIGIVLKDAAVTLNGFALTYQINSNKMQFMSNVYSEMGLADYADNPKEISHLLADSTVIRTADGGFIDNTAVAQMLRYLQDSNKGVLADGFNIIAFDDFPASRPYWDPATQKKPFPTGGDVANLFGFAGCDREKCSMQKDGVHTASLMGLEYKGMSAQVFACDQYFKKDDLNLEQCGGEPLSETLYWWPEEDEEIVCSINDKEVEQPLLYSRYENVVVDADQPGSKLFGINNNATGTLHVFAILGGGASVVPGTEDNFTCYSKMIQGMAKNVEKKASDTNASCNPDEPKSSGNQCTLGDYLEHALELDEPST